MQTRMTALLLIAALLGSGCAGTPSGDTPAGAPAPARRSANLITGAELAEITAENVHQAIQILRPNWFRQHANPTMGGTNRTGGANDVLVVYVENSRYGDVNSLKQLTLGGIAEMRYYDASEATNRYGTGHSQGAIHIRMTTRR